MYHETKICKICGRKFEAKSSKRLYCSTDCKYKAEKLRNNTQTRICKVCGIELPKLYRSYCTECLLKHYHRTNSPGAYDSLVRRGFGEMLLMEHLSKKNYKK